MIPSPGSLQVAFVANGNVWLWREGEEALALTFIGGVEDVRFSDDGQIIAFTRGGELWAVNSDGTDERLLVSGDAFAAIGAAVDAELPVDAHRYEWIPGTHTLAFNTRLEGYGLLLNDDLHLVDADTLELTTLLPPGEGGDARRHAGRHCDDQHDPSDGCRWEQSARGFRLHASQHRL